MSKKIPKILSRLIKEAQKHTIIEVFYFASDTHSIKEETRRAIVRGPSKLTQGRRLERTCLDKGMKSMFDK